MGLTVANRVLGIDEAGRGCVLGPLAVGCFLAVDVSDPQLVEAGAADSKKLSIKKRLLARTALAELGTPFVHLITANEIDQGNLNHLEEHAIVTLVRKFKPDTVIIDALGHPSTLPATLKRLQHAVGSDGARIQWIIEPKQTTTTLSWVRRVSSPKQNETVSIVENRFGDFGSGYPSDPKQRHGSLNGTTQGENGLRSCAPDGALSATSLSKA